ncbi:MAG: CPBP family intramembrane glutamic endopeptidase [Bacteroidia bacterium]|nr:CPBP family intramembrane glutamic endopeptidase [Bacteroidia bacterium]
MLDSLQTAINKDLRLALFFGLFLYTLGLVVLLPIAEIVMSGIYGLKFFEILQILSGNFNVHAQGAQIFRVMQGINQIVTWGMGGLILTRLMGIFPQVLGVRRPMPPLMFFLPVVIIFLSVPLVQAIHISPEWAFWPESWRTGLEVWALQEKTSQESLMLILGESTPRILVLNLFIFAFLPAVCEELFFRGFLQKRLSLAWKPSAAIGVAAIIFSFAHFQFLSFFSRLLLAGLLGYFFHTTQRLLPCIIAHFAYNSATILLIYFSSGAGNTLFGPIGEDIGMNGEIVLLSLISTIILIQIFSRLYKPIDYPPPPYE